ncbi:MAG: hypothetical protein AAGI14_05780 [Pseudomonadota bacterium]
MKSATPHPLSLLVLILASFAILWTASYEIALFGTFLGSLLSAVNKKLLDVSKLLSAIFLLFLSATLLWSFVAFDFSEPSIKDAMDLALGSENLERLSATFSSAFLLAVGFLLIDDGDLYFVLRHLRAPHSLSVIAVSGFSGSASLGASTLRTREALQAQKIVKHGLIDTFLGLPKMIGASWIAALASSLSRFEVKWHLSGYDNFLKSYNSPRHYSGFASATVVATAISVLVFSLA